MGKSEKWLGTWGGCEDWHSVLFLGHFQDKYLMFVFSVGDF